MELNTYERLLLLNNLPARGSFTNLRIMRELREDLSFSEEENTALAFYEDEEDGMLHWDKEGDVPKEFEFGEVAQKIIREALLRVSESEKASEAVLDLWDKFGFTEDE